MTLLLTIRMRIKNEPKQGRATINPVTQNWAAVKIKP
jgi:hypothetical protein